jgi:primase-polymerase (primpol)-like protein
VTAPVRFSIPTDLRKLRQWLIWRSEERDGKRTKVPYQAAKPQVRASTTDARTWGTFEQAVQAVERDQAAGVGFVFAEDDPFCGSDLDNCRNPETGELSAKARTIVEELDSYTERSPSGRGVHIIVRACLHGERNRRGPVELYDHGRYFAMTGERLAGAPWSPMPRQRELDALVARLFPSSVGNGATPLRPIAVRDDREVLERAFAARNGMDFRRLWNGDWSAYGSQSEADLALVSHLAYWSDGDVEQVERLFRSSGLYRPKWERADYRARTIAKALDD